MNIMNNKTPYYTIKKTFRFEAAHRLVDGYQGKCTNIHGHSWEVTFEASSKVLNRFGMVMDFGSLKCMKDWIDKYLDHAMIVKDTDVKMSKFLHNQGFKDFIMNTNPTSENIAKLLFDVAETHSIPITRVTVGETCTCEASYEFQTQ
jgi:6-pyruvoyltetrahydropterin/6-carboxytetrahydropterin synthase